MKKTVLWGAEFYGQNAYRKMKAQFEIVCFVDNDAMLAGKKLFEVPIISATELKAMHSSEMDIIICSRNYSQVSAQLIEMGINEYYVMMEGFLYHNSTSESLMPIELSFHSPLKKEKYEKNILFVESVASARTNEIARIMREAGYKVYLLYMLAPQERENTDFSDIYDGEFTFYTANGMIDFLENSDFDMVHSMSSSLILTNLVLSTSKHIILDVDENPCETVEGLFLEYAAATQSDGILYRSQESADAAKRKYGSESKAAISVNRAIFANELDEFYEEVKQREIFRGK